MARRVLEDTEFLRRIQDESKDESVVRGIQAMIDERLALWRVRLYAHVRRMRRGKQRKRLEIALREAHREFQRMEMSRLRKMGEESGTATSRVAELEARILDDLASDEEISEYRSIKSIGRT